MRVIVKTTQHPYPFARHLYKNSTTHRFCRKQFNPFRPNRCVCLCHPYNVPYRRPNPQNPYKKSSRRLTQRRWQPNSTNYHTSNPNTRRHYKTQKYKNTKEGERRRCPSPKNRCASIINPLRSSNENALVDEAVVDLVAPIIKQYSLVQTSGGSCWPAVPSH